MEVENEAKYNVVLLKIGYMKSAIFFNNIFLGN